MNEELENEVEVETDEIEVITETEDDSTEPQVEQPAEEIEEAVETAAAEEPEQKDEDELAEYSESVQRRIRKLTAKFREEERQREAAIQYAEAVKKQNEELQSQLRTREESYVDEFGARLENDVAAAKMFLKTALEEGDADKIYDAQKRISELTLQQERHSDARLKLERESQQVREVAEQPFAPQQVSQQQQGGVAPDARAQSWADKNPWFGEDESMTYAAFGIHRRLVEEEGFDPSSEEYYTEIDKRIRRDFPAKFEEAPKKAAKPRVASAESTASRSSNKGRRTVKLSDSQIAIAKKLGVPLEEYAKYVKD